MARWRFGGLLIAILFVLLIGSLLQDASFTVMAEFGLLIYFYYSYQEDGSGLTCMLVNGASAWLGFGALLFLPQSIVLKGVVLAGFAGITMLITKTKYPNPIGPFFVIMIASLGGTVEIAPMMLLKEWGYLAAGIVISFVAALGVQQIGKRVSHRQFVSKNSFSAMSGKQINMLSSGYGVTLLVAYLVNLVFPYQHYNWLTVSAAANLKADAIKLALQRYGWYLLGNLVGVILVWAISQLTSSMSVLLVLTALFFMIIALVININYGLALSFATPLAIFLFDILHGSLNDDLMTIRLVSIFIGSLIGLCGDLAINYLLRLSLLKSPD